MTRRPGRLRLVPPARRRRAAGGLDCSNTYGLSPQELRAEIRRRARQGWAAWEIARRFGCECKEDA